MIYKEKTESMKESRADDLTSIEDVANEYYGTFSSVIPEVADKMRKDILRAKDLDSAFRIGEIYTNLNFYRFMDNDEIVKSIQNYRGHEDNSVYFDYKLAKPYLDKYIAKEEVTEDTDKKIKQADLLYSSEGFNGRQRKPKYALQVTSPSNIYNDLLYWIKQEGKSSVDRHYRVNVTPCRVEDIYKNSISVDEFMKWYEKEALSEDTVKQGNAWVNKGKEGTHGKFRTKKEADAQRKAMFANKGKGASFGENLKEARQNNEFYRGEVIWNYGDEDTFEVGFEGKAREFPSKEEAKKAIDEYRKDPHYLSKYERDYFSGPEEGGYTSTGLILLDSKRYPNYDSAVRALEVKLSDYTEDELEYVGNDMFEDSYGYVYFVEHDKGSEHSPAKSWAEAELGEELEDEDDYALRWQAEFGGNAGAELMSVDDFKDMLKRMEEFE